MQGDQSAVTLLLTDTSTGIPQLLSRDVSQQHGLYLLFQAGAVIIPTLQMRKARLGDAMTQGSPACELVFEPRSI